jgi:dienelactone hydrolase
MRRMIHLKASLSAAVLSLWLLPALASAEIKTQEVEYKQGSTVLQGFVAFDDAIKGKRPGVLIVHEWWGHNEHAREQARRIAKAGYVGFALDMFGKGKLATHPEDAKAFTAEATASPAIEKARFDAALAVLKKQPEVNPKQIAAIGYCFGGGVALDMARMGEPLAVVATFHGSLATKEPAKKGAVKPKLLILAGADDPMVNKEAVAKFKEEMTAAGAKYEVIEYPGAKHAFTNPEAGKFGVPGLEYNAKADQESFAALIKLLTETFGAPKTAEAAKPGAAVAPTAAAPSMTPKPAAAPSMTPKPAAAPSMAPKPAAAPTMAPKNP